MGLDTSHEAYHGGYSSFNRWRDYIGRVAGYRAELGYEKYDGTEDLKERERQYGLKCRAAREGVLSFIAASSCSFTRDELEEWLQEYFPGTRFFDVILINWIEPSTLTINRNYIFGRRGR